MTTKIAVAIRFVQHTCSRLTLDWWVSLYLALALMMIDFVRVFGSCFQLLELRWSHHSRLLLICHTPDQFSVEKHHLVCFEAKDSLASSFNIFRCNLGKGWKIKHDPSSGLLADQHHSRHFCDFSACYMSSFLARRSHKKFLEHLNIFMGEKWTVPPPAFSRSLPSLLICFECFGRLV